MVGAGKLVRKLLAAHSWPKVAQQMVRPACSFGLHCERLTLHPLVMIVDELEPAFLWRQKRRHIAWRLGQHVHGLLQSGAAGADHGKC